jgi:DNA polymerase-1
MATAVKKSTIKEKPAKPIYLTYEDYEPEDLYLYAGLDNIATNTVTARMFPLLIEEPVYFVPDANGKAVSTNTKSILDTNEEVTKISFEYILDMEINGLKYDIAKNERIGKKMVAEIAELEVLIFANDFIPRDINFDSGKEITDLLYVKLGLEPPFFTKSGEPSTDGEALLTLAGLNPLNPPKNYKTPDPDKQFLAWIAKRKDINSTYNTFIKTYVKDFVKRDGRIHPNYNLHGTSGFRISGDRPNLTQIPRPKHGYNIRECYTVEKGYVFIAFDFSSAEVKILGALCKDPAMLKAIEEGLDFHSFSASSMLNVPYDEFMGVLSDPANEKYKEYKGIRQTAKVLTFSILYGSSVGGIAMQLNISKEDAQYYMDLYFNAYPGMKTFIESAHKQAIWNQRVVTPFGQRRQEYGTYKCFKGTAAYNAALRNSANVLVQSTTSTLGLIVFAKLNQALKKFRSKAICTVYDSAEFEVPIEHAAEAIEMCFHYLNEVPQTLFPWLTLPVGCEGELGLNWGECEIVHRGVSQKECEEIITKLKQNEN